MITIPNELSQGVYNVWNSIAPDFVMGMEAAHIAITNDEAINFVLDGGCFEIYCDEPEAVIQLYTLIKEHGFHEVVAAIAKVCPVM